MSNTGPGAKVAVCTIVAKNYLHFARTLMDSLRVVHPDWRQYVLLTDEIGGAFDPSGERFEVIEVDRLPLPQPRKFLFRYTILELCTAVKPWLLRWLFETQGADRVIYLDPDIYVYRPMREVEQALDAGSLMVLTPHLTAPLPSGPKPNERDILQAGAYNLGFLALARHAQLEPFLSWWEEKLEYDCRVDLPEGLFVDQKWMDLAPGMFGDASVLRHDGYNVAYWNLARRRVSKAGGDFQVNDRPLVFFHFSGLDPRTPAALSKHQERFRLSDLGAGAELVERYSRDVIANDMATCSRWPYAFGFFADGGAIPSGVRLCYRTDPEAERLCGDDPFRSDGAYFNEPCDKGERLLVTKQMHALWRSRADLRNAFPNLSDGHRLNYVTHYIEHLAPTEKIPRRFVDPVAASLDQLLQPWAKPFVIQGPSPSRRVLRDLVRRVLPARSRQQLRAGLRLLLGGAVRPAEAAPSPQIVQRRPPLVRSNLPSGLNIVGYIRSESGVGESARRCAQAADAAGVPFSLYNFSVGDPNGMSDHTWSWKITRSNGHLVNLFHINADQMPAAYAALGAAFFDGRYNIGFWHWELPVFPERWQPSFDLVDEVWVPSQFVHDAVSRQAPVPVLRMPHAIDFRTDQHASRSALGLPETNFLFLTMYDTRSFQARKNPEGAIAAFRKAFAHRRDVALVVKINNPASCPNEVAALKAALAGNANILVLDRILSRQDVYNLEGLCDCFVSLHRSEGFGFGLAESMYLGKPVIATNWSGNRDFMNHANSCPVDYALVRLERDYGPYERGQQWADPDLEQAAWYMTKIVNEPAWRRDIAARSQQTIRADFSPATVGRLYQARLQTLAARYGTAAEPTRRAA